MSNQVVMYGTNESYPVVDGIFFLEYLESDGATTVTIKDGDGNTICTGVSDFSNDYSPLRCDKGIEFVGDVAIAKGFFVPGVFFE